MEVEFFKRIFCLFILIVQDFLLSRRELSSVYSGDERIHAGMNIVKRVEMDNTEELFIKSFWKT
jgi:hypothetical protein